MYVCLWWCSTSSSASMRVMSAYLVQWQIWGFKVYFLTKQYSQGLQESLPSPTGLRAYIKDSGCLNRSYSLGLQGRCFYSIFYFVSKVFFPLKKYSRISNIEGTSFFSRPPKTIETSASSGSIPWISVNMSLLSQYL